MLLVQKHWIPLRIYMLLIQKHWILLWIYMLLVQKHWILLRIYMLFVQKPPMRRRRPASRRAVKKAVFWRRRVGRKTRAGGESLPEPSLRALLHCRQTW